MLSILENLSLITYRVSAYKKYGVYLIPEGKKIRDLSPEGFGIKGFFKRFFTEDFGKNKRF